MQARTLGEWLTLHATDCVAARRRLPPAGRAAASPGGLQQQLLLASSLRESSCRGAGREQRQSSSQRPRGRAGQPYSLAPAACFTPLTPYCPPDATQATQAGKYRRDGKHQQRLRRRRRHAARCRAASMGQHTRRYFHPVLVSSAPSMAFDKALTAIIDTTVCCQRLHAGAVGAGATRSQLYILAPSR